MHIVLVVREFLTMVEGMFDEIIRIPYVFFHHSSTVVSSL